MCCCLTTEFSFTTAATTSTTSLGFCSFFFSFVSFALSLSLFLSRPQVFSLGSSFSFCDMFDMSSIFCCVYFYFIFFGGRKEKEEVNFLQHVLSQDSI